jgi:hypothetical protein
VRSASSRPRPSTGSSARAKASAPFVHIKGLPGPVIERLDVAYDERVFAYSIINETALPLTRYIAVVELADAPGGRCTVRWGSNWIAKDRPEESVRKMLTQLYTTLIDGIVRVAGASG